MSNYAANREMGDEATNGRHGADRLLICGGPNGSTGGTEAATAGAVVHPQYARLTASRSNKGNASVQRHRCATERCDGHGPPVLGKATHA
jgi:hypothetical protein